MPAGHTTVRNNRQKQTSVATVAGITVTATVVDIHGSRLVDFNLTFRCKEKGIGKNGGWGQ